MPSGEISNFHLNGIFGMDSTNTIEFNANGVLRMDNFLGAKEGSRARSYGHQ